MSSTSNKTSSTLVRISWGALSDRKVSSFTDHNETVATSKGTFTPDPLLRVHPVDLFGSLEEPLRKIDLSLSFDGLKAGITAGEAWPTTTVEVWELHRAPSGDAYYMVFKGDVIRAIRNPKGSTEIYQLSIAGEKYKLNGKRLGIPMLEICDNTFGDPNTCKVQTNPISEVATITAIDDQTVTITGLSTQGVGYWTKGYVEAFDLRLRIQNWDSNQQFLLNRPPPTDQWLGASATVVPGCDGTSAVCYGRWNNLSNFNGLGIRMPDYHPIMENPRGT